MLQSLVNAEKIRVPGERLYEEDIYGKDLNVLQVKTLQRLSASADATGVIKLLGENINIDVNKLFFDDFKYLIHWFRLKSFKNFPHMVGFSCNHCHGSNEQAVTGGNLMIDDVPEELSDNGTVLIALENYPNGIYIRPPKIGDEMITNKMMKKYKFEEDNIDMHSLFLDLNLFRNRENGKDIEELYEEYKRGKFTPDDLMTITAFKTEFTWGVRDTYKFNCSHCGEEVIVEEPLDLTNFFLPTESRRLVRNRILSSIPTKTGTDESGTNIVE